MSQNHPHAAMATPKSTSFSASVWSSSAMARDAAQDVEDAVASTSHHVRRPSVAEAMRGGAREACLLDENLQSPVEAAGRDGPAGVPSDDEVVVLPLRPGRQPLLGLVPPVAGQSPKGLVFAWDHAPRTGVVRVTPHRPLRTGTRPSSMRNVPFAASRSSHLSAS